MSVHASWNEVERYVFDMLEHALESRPYEYDYNGRAYVSQVYPLRVGWGLDFPDLIEQVVGVRVITSAIGDLVFSWQDE